MSRSKKLGSSPHLQATPELALSFVGMTELSSAFCVGDLAAMIDVTRKFWKTAVVTAEAATGLARTKILCMGMFHIVWGDYYSTSLETNSSWDESYGQDGGIFLEINSSMASNFESWHADINASFSVNTLTAPAATLRPMLFHWGPNARGLESLVSSWQECFRKLQHRSPDPHHAADDTINYWFNIAQNYVLLQLSTELGRGPDLAQEHLRSLGMADADQVDKTMDAWLITLGVSTKCIHTISSTNNMVIFHHCAGDA